MAKICSGKSLLFLLAALCITVATGQDDMDSWLRLMAATSDSDSNAPSTTPFSDSKTSPGGSGDNAADHKSRGQHSKSGDQTKPAPQNMFVKFPKPKGPTKKITVSKTGKSDFHSINAALDSIRSHSTYRTVIHIKEGVYHEKVFINDSKPYITFLGDGNDKTIITWNDTAGDFDDQDVLLKTYKSATVGVNSQYFIAIDIQFRNTAPQPPPGAALRQAVAMRITGDRAAFYNCSFYGYQDTLYDHRGRHYFENSQIYGSIDFIFGNGRSLYKNCLIHSEATTFGSLTAQKRNESHMNTGFSFVDATISGSGPIYLGRAWGNYSRTVYSYTWMDNIIYAPGWSDFGFPDRQTKVFYAQYDCKGPGANTAQRVPWVRQLSSTEAAPFLSINFINGKSWLKSYIKS